MNQFIIPIIIAIAIFLAWSVSAQSAEPFTVVRHYDGDTTTVRDRDGNQFNVRYLVIDANELKQAGGVEARDYLYRLAPVGSKVSIAFTGNKSHNRYEGTVYRNGKNINLAMLQAGYAVIDPRYIKRLAPELRSQYQQAQDNARRKRLGRWSSQKTQQMPSEWRNN